MKKIKKIQKKIKTTSQLILRKLNFLIKDKVLISTYIKKSNQMKEAEKF